ncbi:hypothetical protein [Pseudomonas sp. NFACC37-1]|uniref:hypothetical protein n=1 Tax=Pseudomonas sp. NFACC37-1 TaxID=1566196 RepID=UPI00088C4290|nr:hypothetical protein [Pseudomonas sp. NFACC37-1]SCZ11600.1 hypothetical protein SAMN03159391_05579 [Pseudomonas sp. NFACC37-1]
MSRRPANKTIHYVRAVYRDGTAPAKNFEQLVRQAMTKLGRMDETDISMSTLGVVSVRHRETKTGESLRLAIGAGVPGEQMTTIGIKVAAAYDNDQSTSAPTNRAFKHADAFVLIEENDVLLVTEGPFRVATVGAYLRGLFIKAGLKSETAAFELRKVTNQNIKSVLAEEGVKELRLGTTMHQATDALAEVTSSVKGKLKSFVGTLKNAFSDDISEKQLQQLAEHWGEVQVSTVISAKGGSRAVDIVLDAMLNVGEEVLEESEEGVDVTVITQKGTPIRLNEVTPTKSIRLYRREGANDLINTEVYSELMTYRAELLRKGHWKQ